jgi:2-oxoglutarate dehydrogenase E2 component (dihydrolipoamide succinyltransferase)
MATEIKVPTLGESVTEATVAKWFKSAGEAVEADEPVVELETDKVTLEVNAPVGGVLAEIVADEGDEVEVGALLGKIDEGAAPAKGSAKKDEKKDEKKADTAPPPAAKEEKKSDGGDAPLSPAVDKLVEEKNLDPSKIPASGKDGRLTKGDVLDYLEDGAKETKAEAKKESPKKEPRETGPREERVRMSRLRQRIAERLKQAQNTAAMLTTFNDVDMTAVMALRKQYRETFEKKHGVRLGFMSFFVKACIVALQEIPAVNAEVDGTDIIYKNYYDIGVAVGTEQGLVVPVIRDADQLSFGEIEATINTLGLKARDGKLSMDELTGGTFTISNGGVYGSMLSTPILNPPQSGILGMHRIEDRPVAIDGQVVIRPMMYLALSYDHRIVDGREAVTFLKRVKECLEDPQRILLDM